MTEPPTVAGDTDAPGRRSPAASWRWLTFPVYFAFATGLLIASLLNVETDNAIEGVVQIAALLLFGYGLAHLIIINVVVAGRIRRSQRGTHEDGGSDEWEDEVVYPDEAPPHP